MTESSIKTQEQVSWKSRTYLAGTVLGGVIGLLAAYLFARTAEENTDHQPPQIATTQLIGIGLALLGIMRQIAEMGKKKSK